MLRNVYTRSRVRKSVRVASWLGTYVDDQVQQVVDEVCGDAGTPKTAVLGSPRVNLHLNLGHGHGARHCHSNRQVGAANGCRDDGGGDHVGRGAGGVARRVQLCIIVVLHAYTRQDGQSALLSCVRGSRVIVVTGKESATMDIKSPSLYTQQMHRAFYTP